jgi:hypothetical protein
MAFGKTIRCRTPDGPRCERAEPSSQLETRYLCSTREPPKAAPWLLARPNGLKGLTCYAGRYAPVKKSNASFMLFAFASSNTRLRGKPAKRVCPLEPLVRSVLLHCANTPPERERTNLALTLARL